MAIRRCPYCKAIIDESQKYCNNCGTQLLFPEDDQVEEDIKGERIVDEDFKDADAEFDDSAEPADAGDDQREEIDLEVVLEGGKGFPDEVKTGGKIPDRPVTRIPAEEPESVAEEAPLPKKGRIRKVSLPAPSVPVKAPPRRPTANLPPPPSESAAPLKPPTAPIKPLTATPPPPAPPPLPTPVPPITPVPKDGRSFMFGHTPKDEEPDLEMDPDSDLPSDPDLEPEDDEEAEKRDREVDTKEEIARLIEALEKKQKNSGRQDTGEKIFAPLDDSKDLPPWANLSEDTSAAEPVEEDPGERMEASSYVPGDTMDFQDEVMRGAGVAAPPKPTIGMPEVPVKKDSAYLFDRDVDEDRPEILVPPAAPTPAVPRKPAPAPAPVTAPAADTGESLGQGYALPDVDAGAAAEAVAPRVGLGFFRRCAAAIFDLVFVAVLWLAAVGLASLLMDADARRLVRAAMLPFGLLFAVLFAGYLFLFFFFLGETLGGRLMARRD
jgi:hypothetical protein